MTKFLIWFQHRSGSTHLVSLLNSHSQIRCKGEIFGCVPLGRTLDPNAQPPLNSEEYLCGHDLFRRVLNQFPGRQDNPSTSQCHNALEQLWDEKKRATPINGFKFKFPSQATVFPEVGRYVKSLRNDLRIIVLHRKNLLRRALSVLNLPRIQAATQQANSREAILLPPIVFDVNEILRLIRYYQEIEGEFTKWTRDFKNVLEIEYEDLVAQPENTSIDIQEFLQVTNLEPMNSKIKKVGANDIEQIVSNYSELRDCLHQNGLLEYMGQTI